MTTFVKGMNKNKNITTSFAKNSLLVLALFAVVQYVFAVSGIRSKASSGDDKTKSTVTTSGFSNLKSSVTFSLKDSYRIPSKNNFKFDIPETSEIKNQPNSISLVSFRKGNTTYVIPYKTKSGVKFPSFIKLCPSPAPER